MLKHEIFTETSDFVEVDPSDLIRKLIEYEKYKSLSLELSAIYEDNNQLEKEEDEYLTFVDEESDRVINILTNGFNDFQISIDSIIQRMKDNQVVETVIHLQRISPEIRRKELLEQIHSDGDTTFLSLLDSTNKYYIAVSLLVLLELANEGKITLKQSKNFDDILVLDKTHV
jgi:chromatin segregation and condensation protein Rec8/ScpA/Scc1 (kleisin family)